MRMAVNQSLDIERYRKFAIDLNAKNGEPESVFDLRRSMQLKQPCGKATQQDQLLGS